MEMEMEVLGLRVYCSSLCLTDDTFTRMGILWPPSEDLPILVGPGVLSKTPL